MPYKTNADLPSAVKGALPAAAQTLFRGAFNGAMSQSGTSEESAMRIAWAAVKKRYKKGADGTWELMAGDALPQFYWDAKYTAEQRKEMAAKGEAMAGGAYPIADLEDLQNAIHAIGRGNASSAAIKRHIIKRARALDAVKELPAEWNVTDTSFELFDAITIDDAAHVRYTADGYLVANPRVSRTGIQRYSGYEVGRPQMDVVRVYRPESEVFSKDSMASFAFKPVTNDHPPVPVTSHNWRDYGVGQMGGEIARDGESIRVPMVVMDEAAIQAYKDGKAQLSVGYTCDLKWESGTDPASGETYDAVQTTVRANHTAMVWEGRAGEKYRIGDGATGLDPVLEQQLLCDHDSGATEDETMPDPLKKIVVDGISCEMTDTAAAIVEKFMRQSDAAVADLKKQLQESTAALTKAQTDHATAITTATKTIETKDAELVTVKKQLEDAKLTPAKLDAMVKDRELISSKARAVLGDKLVTDGKTDAEIMRQVVDAKVGDAAKGWSEDAVKASFATLTADIEASAVHDTARAFSAGNGHRPGPASQQTKDKAYTTYDTDLSNRWKGDAINAAKH